MSGFPRGRAITPRLICGWPSSISLPSVFAFVLSFGIILIGWVNHHEMVKLIDKSSMPFIYANGFLPLGTVFVPFPTALLGESLLTRHAATGRRPLQRPAR
jgi:uncharacterized membrane protein